MTVTQVPQVKPRERAARVAARLVVRFLTSKLWSGSAGIGFYLNQRRATLPCRSVARHEVRGGSGGGRVWRCLAGGAEGDGPPVQFGEHAGHLGGATVG